MKYELLNNKSRFTLRIPSSLKKELVKIARTNSISVNELINNSLMRKVGDSNDTDR